MTNDALAQVLRATASAITALGLPDDKIAECAVDTSLASVHVEWRCEVGHVALAVAQERATLTLRRRMSKEHRRADGGVSAVSSWTETEWSGEMGAEAAGRAREWMAAKRGRVEG